MQARAAATEELDCLARLWYDAWQDAHAQILPAALTRYRTIDSFRQRLAEAIASVRVAGPAGAPLGFCMVRDDELYQIFVAAAGRGTGLASILLGDGEARLAAAGVTCAWLACAIGNERAAKFYAKHGWHRAGIVTRPLETQDGPFPLDVWRYEKNLH